MEENIIISGDYSYFLNEDGTATIDKYNGKVGTDIVIPRELDGHIVSVIGADAFDTFDIVREYRTDEAGETIPVEKDPEELSETDKRSIVIADASGCDFYSSLSPKSVVIPETVKMIDENAFGACQLLESVVIEGDDVTINEGAFWACSSLKSLRIPGDNIVIGFNAFESCTSLTDVEITGSHVKIDRSAFLSCHSLVSIDLSGADEIDLWAFANCSSLEKVRFSSVNIKANPFQVCPALKQIEFDCDDIVFENNALVERKTDRLIALFCDNGSESCVIPDGIRIIGTAVMNNGEALKSVSIPASVTSINKGAFMESGLTVTTSPGIPGDKRCYEFIPTWGSLIAFITVAFSKDARLRVVHGSYAESYCVKNKLRYTLVSR